MSPVGNIEPHAVPGGTSRSAVIAAEKNIVAVRKVALIGVAFGLFGTASRIRIARTDKSSGTALTGIIAGDIAQCFAFFLVIAEA